MKSAETTRWTVARR